MDKEKLNHQTESAACSSKQICFNKKSEDNIIETDPLDITSNSKPQKSHSLLSALVHRKISKTKKLDKKIKTLQNLNNLKYINSNSTIASHSGEEIKVTPEIIGNPESTATKETGIKRTETSDSEQSLVSSIKIKRRFFSKFCKIGDSKKKSRNVHTIEGGNKMVQTISQIRLSLEKAEQVESPQCIPTSFIQLNESAVPCSLMTGLISVQNLASRLQQSEGHLLQIFTKYVSDVSLQKELVDTLCLHSHLHLETERMNNVLSMEMWLKQIEVEKVQETALQEALNSVIRHNRQIQSEYETLFCTYEKLLKKFKHFNERDSSIKCDPGFDNQIQDVIKHNIKLTHKTELLYKQLDRLEIELTNYREKNENLETQLSSSLLQYHDIEAVFHQTKADYELEIATLNHQLKNKENILVNVIDVCYKLKKDLVGKEDQIKGISLTIDWNKLKCHEEGLSDFIEFSRIYISDLTNELVTLRKQIYVKEKEIEMLMETNEKLQNNLIKSTTELDGLAKKIDESDKLLAEHRYKCLEADIRLKEEQIERVKFEFDAEKSALIRKNAEFENLNKEKSTLLEQSTVYINNLGIENTGLRNQIERLNHLLQDNGAGDLVKELNTNKEQMVKLDFQCRQLLSEKQLLLNQIEFLKEDYKKFSEYQSTSNQHLHRLQNDVENVSNEYRQLEQKYEAEKQTVSSLQLERKKYLEEKALIKTLFHHMKSEINRLQQLEQTVNDMSKEANKLAMIANYNKQLGKTLKSELEEKDNTIVKLRSNLEYLNGVQMENAKEKLTLCNELSALCQMKEKLNHELSWEVQKNFVLDGAKKEIVEAAQSQLHQYEEFHKKEKIVLKDLLKDLKYVVKQRNSLISEREVMSQELDFLNRTTEKQIEQQNIIDEYKKQIEDQRTLIDEQRKQIVEQTKQIGELEIERKNTEDKIRQFEEEQEDDKSKITHLEERLGLELKTYNDTVRQMDQFIFELQKEKDRVDDTVKYLQNNTQKLHNDLNTSRSNEKEFKDALTKCLAEKICLEKDICSKQRLIETINVEKQTLKNEINQINEVCEKVLADFEDSLNTSMKKEEIFKAEIRESQNALINISKENEQLTSELSIIKDEFEGVSKEFSNLKEQEQKWINLIQSFENKKEIFKNIVNQKEKLEYDISSLREDYKIVKEDLRIARQECESLFRQMKTVVEQKQAEILNHKKETDDIIKMNQEMQISKDQDIARLKSNVNDLYQKLENERSSYTALSQIHKEISTKFLKSIKDIVDEKNARHEAERKVKEADEYYEKLQIEKGELEQKVDDILKKLDEKRNVINILKEEKETCEMVVCDFQKKYNDILQQCTSLEDKLKEIQSNDSVSEELKFLQKENARMKKDSEETHQIIMTLQKEIGLLQKEVTSLEFQKSEVTLKLHELQRKFETEQNICDQLKNVQKIVLDGILEMKNEGVVGKEHCDRLINYIKNDSTKGDCFVKNSDNL